MPIPSTRIAPRLHRNGWTPERRARQSAAIRNWRPWTRATGPRTLAGKAAIRNNARTHGLCSAAGRELMEALKLQRKFIQAVNLALKLVRLRQEHQKCANKLLECGKAQPDEALAASWPVMASHSTGLIAKRVYYRRKSLNLFAIFATFAA